MFAVERWQIREEMATKIYETVSIALLFHGKPGGIEVASEPLGLSRYSLLGDGRCSSRAWIQQPLYVGVVCVLVCTSGLQKAAVAHGIH